MNPDAGTARGKLLLFGEHAAVYGHPAVGLSLPWSLTVTRTPGPGWDFPGAGDHRPALEALVDRLEVLAGDEGLPWPVPGTLEFRSAIPLSSGFGSSGALCAALVNLFWPEAPLEIRDRLAWLAEGQFHGTPSGIDTALALRQGWWALDPSVKPVRAAPVPDPGLVLVAGSLVRRADTKTLVGSLARRRADDEALVARTLDELGGLSAQAARLLAAGQGDGVVPLVRRARTGLAALGLETPELSAVLDAGLGCRGARAGKLSGAGGGGAFFLVFESAEAAREALPRIAGAVGSGAWTAAPRLIGP